MELNQVVGMVRGPVGESVTLVILRPPEMGKLTFEIKRQRFTLPSIAWRPLDQFPNIGLIDINLFAASTPEEVTTAIEELQTQGVEYFIIDLQGNGGGLLDSGIDLARLFLEDGEVLYQQYRGQDVETYKVTKAGPFTDLPVVILTDHNTASASEIFAGSLQFHQRAKLIGAPTFGKNTIQLIFTLEDDSSVHITSAVWWLPDSGPNEDFRLIPDVEISPEVFSYETVLEAAVKELIGQ
jgi:carboxyl-terminal processing protease